MFWFLLFLTTPSLAMGADCLPSCMYGYSGDIEDFVCFCPPIKDEEPTPKPGTDSNGRPYYIEILKTGKGWIIRQKYI